VSQAGKPVKIRRGTAAVTAHATSIIPLSPDGKEEEANDRSQKTGLIKSKYKVLSVISSASRAAAISE